MLLRFLSQKRQMFQFLNYCLLLMTQFGLIYLFRVVWIDNYVDAVEEQEVVSHTALHPAGCTEGKTIIIAIWKASVQPVPHSLTQRHRHTDTHTASLLLLHISRQCCPLSSGSRLSLLCGCLCWAMLYLLVFTQVLLWSRRRAGEPQTPSARVRHLAAQRRFSQTNNSAALEGSHDTEFKWTRKLNKYNERQTFARFATDDLNRVSVLMVRSRDLSLWRKKEMQKLHKSCDFKAALPSDESKREEGFFIFWGRLLKEFYEMWLLKKRFSDFHQLLCHFGSIGAAIPVIWPSEKQEDKPDGANTPGSAPWTWKL